MKIKKQFKNNFTSLIKEDGNSNNILCKYFGQCGGCDLQELSYFEQVQAKELVFQDLIDKAYLTECIDGFSTKLSERQSRYRQKMSFVCAFDKVGLRSVDGYKGVVDLDDCHIAGQKSMVLLNDIKALIKQVDLSTYDYLNHQGDLRYITIRQMSNDTILVSFLTKDESVEEKIEEIAKVLVSKGITSIHWNLNGNQSDSSFGIEKKYWGDEFVYESIASKEFLVGSNTFFQANLQVAEFAYNEIKIFLKANSVKSVGDLYSGTATIAIVIADVVEKVIAVENFEPNFDLAKRNLIHNKIDNVLYLHKDVKDFFEEYDEKLEAFVLNPPRSGVDEKVLRQIIKASPMFISYLSCNPMSLMEDLGILTIHYDVIKLHLLDMFPQTHHFETLTFLKKRQTLRL